MNMNITLICIEKTDEQSLEELISKYEKRLPNHWNYKRIEIPDIKNRKNLSETQQKEKKLKINSPNSILQNNSFCLYKGENHGNLIYFYLQLKIGIINPFEH